MELIPNRQKVGDFHEFICSHIIYPPLTLSWTLPWVLGIDTRGTKTLPVCRPPAWAHVQARSLTGSNSLGSWHGALLAGASVGGAAAPLQVGTAPSWRHRPHHALSLPRWGDATCCLSPHRVTLPQNGPTEKGKVFSVLFCFMLIKNRKTEDRP